jgi:hypothetical protein
MNDKVLDIVIVAFDEIERTMINQKVSPDVWKRFKRGVLRDIERTPLENVRVKM